MSVWWSPPEDFPALSRFTLDLSWCAISCVSVTSVQTGVQCSNILVARSGQDFHGVTKPPTVRPIIGCRPSCPQSGPIRLAGSAALEKEKEGERQIRELRLPIINYVGYFAGLWNHHVTFMMKDKTELRLVDSQ